MSVLPPGLKAQPRKASRPSPALLCVMEEVLGNMRADTAKGWLLGANAVYQRIQGEGTLVRSQGRFMELARERAKESEALLGLQSKPLTLATPRALDKLRRRAGKKRKRKPRED